MVRVRVSRGGDARLWIGSWRRGGRRDRCDGGFGWLGFGAIGVRWTERHDGVGRVRMNASDKWMLAMALR
jgi:hypothetical protein